MGKSKSGKNALADMLLLHNTNGAQLAFADKLKTVCMDLFGLTHDDCYTEEGKNRITEFPCYKCPACGSINCTLEAPTQVVCAGCTAVGAPEAFASFWTVRMVLQHVGTEGIRRVNDKTWVTHALTSAAALPAASFILITDCRFKSEAEAVWAAGGEVWRIRRPETDRKFQGIAGHKSETEMDTIPDSKFQRVINNDATLDVLRGKAVEGLTEFLRTRA